MKRQVKQDKIQQQNEERLERAHEKRREKMARKVQTFAEQVSEWRGEMNRRARTMHNPPDASQPQTLGDPFTNERGPGYRNDCSPGAWYRAPNEDATTKPAFDSVSERLGKEPAKTNRGYEDSSIYSSKPKAPR
jgi:hypothetical protein